MGTGRLSGPVVVALGVEVQVQLHLVGRLRAPPAPLLHPVHQPVLLQLHPSHTLRPLALLFPQRLPHDPLALLEEAHQQGGAGGRRGGGGHGQQELQQSVAQGQHQGEWGEVELDAVGHDVQLLEFLLPAGQQPLEAEEQVEGRVVPVDFPGQHQLDWLDLEVAFAGLPPPLGRLLRVEEALHRLHHWPLHHGSAVAVDQPGLSAQHPHAHHCAVVPASLVQHHEGVAEGRLGLHQLSGMFEVEVDHLPHPGALLPPAQQRAQEGQRVDVDVLGGAPHLQHLEVVLHHQGVDRPLPQRLQAGPVELHEGGRVVEGKAVVVLAQAVERGSRPLHPLPDFLHPLLLNCHSPRIDFGGNPLEGLAGWADWRIGHALEQGAALFGLVVGLLRDSHFGGVPVAIGLGLLFLLGTGPEELGEVGAEGQGLQDGVVLVGEGDEFFEGDVGEHAFACHDISMV